MHYQRGAGTGVHNSIYRLQKHVIKLIVGFNPYVRMYNLMNIASMCNIFLLNDLIDYCTSI